jgi:hypothetical protein
MPVKSEIKKWLPHLGTAIWLQTLPLLVMFSVLWFTAQDTLGLLASTVKFWEYVLYGWAYAVSGYWLGLVVCLRYLRSVWLAVLFAWFYLLLYVVNIGMLHSGGIVLVHFYVRIADATNWLPYVTKWLWMMIGVFVVCGLAASWLVYKYAADLKQVRVRKLLVLLVLLWAVVQLSKHNYIHPSAVVTRIVGKQQAGAWQVTQTETLRMVADNPVVILGKALFTVWQPLQLRPVSELAAMADTIKTWNLALGPRNYPPLGLKPFNHIIVFATESMSLDFMSPYNASLPPEITPFYGSTAVTQAMFVNYKTVAGPTQPGLVVTYNSHPNVRALLVGQSELSLAKLLDAQGYETYVLMPCSENFLGNRNFFTRLGFQHVIGLETLEKDPKILPFVEGRGVMDRAIYETALNLLAQNRDKKIYLHIMNSDTHGPVPRDNFGSLQYPPVPDSIAASVKDVAGDADDDARAILKEIFRFDYDLGLTMRRMQERNLLTDDTLVVLTADHSFPRTKALNNIPGYPSTSVSRIPLAFFSGQPLPNVDRNEFCSQLDFAPSIAHLLNLPIPQGWWGESVFDTNHDSSYVMRFNDKLSVTTVAGAPVQSISISQPANEAETNLLKIFNSLYVDPPKTNSLSQSP